MLICAQVVRAVDKGWLHGAALDVFQEEPLPSHSLLWKHPQVKGRRIRIVYLVLLPSIFCTTFFLIQSAIESYFYETDFTPGPSQNDHS